MSDERRRALYEQYVAVPEGQAAEIIGGRLHVSPWPSPRHANVTSVLGGELNGAFQRGRGGPGGWRIINKPELHLDTLEPLQPDICGWRKERMPALPDTAFFTLAPDWVCEVLSPSTETRDRNEKLPIYARHGVRHVWLVDPEEETLEVYALGDDHRWVDVRLSQADARVHAEPFAAIEIDLAALWG